MRISISHKGFETKPQSKEISQMIFNVEDLSIEEFAQYISKGYCYCNIFNQSVITIKDKNKGNFRYSNIISVDIDHSNISMETALSLIITKPSIAYETYSNGKDGLFSFRFVYCLNDDVWISKINAVIDYFYDKVEAELSITTDKRTRNPYQYFNGTFNKTVITNDITYNISDLSLNKAPLERSNTPSGIIIPKIEKRALKADYDNNPFIDDFFNLKYGELVSKYNDSFINKEHSELPTSDEDTPLIYFPKDFREIRRYWYQTIHNDVKSSHIRRIKDGMGRRHKLFINGIIRRLIEPKLTFENILFNLAYEMYYYIDNKDKGISKTILYNLAKNIHNEDLTKYNDLGKSKRKYMANPLYCIKHNLNKNTVSKMKINYDAVGELYDCSISDKENCKVMSEFGINIKPRTLRNWRYKNNIESVPLTNNKGVIEMYIQKNDSIMNLNDTPNGTVNTLNKDTNNIIKDKTKMKQERTKKINYVVVNEVVKLGLSLRKSVELLKEKGVTMSKSQYQRYVSSLNGTVVNGTPLNGTVVNGTVNSEHIERVAEIEVEYNGTILKAYEKRHRSYPIDGLTDFPLYMVLSRDELKDYQFLDCEQLIKVGISPTCIYNWNEGCCLPPKPIYCNKELALAV